MHHCIINLNSSKLMTPSPLRSNRLIITLHSSMDLNSPSLLNIFFKSLGVMNPFPSVSYIWKASFKSFVFSASPPSSNNPMKSSKSNNPSPFESNASIATWASFNFSSPPIKRNLWLNSDAETFPSPSISK
ncbi:hypothetical protein V6Z11_A11G040500 [Gossypium hirsutum]